MHFSLSLLSGYLNINEETSKKSPCVGQAFRDTRGTRRRLVLEPEASAAFENSTAALNILELGICEIRLLSSGVPAVGWGEFC